MTKPTNRSPPSFEPTYEELKLVKGEYPDNPVRRFEPTYEELKLEYGDVSFKIEVRFEPTYEELKQRKDEEIAQLTGVLSLPMRN